MSTKVLGQGQSSDSTMKFSAQQHGYLGVSSADDQVVLGATHAFNKANELQATHSVDTSEQEAARRRALAEIDRDKRPFTPETIRVSGLESWTGRVLDLDEDLFTAELVPASGGPSVYADFDRAQLGPERDLSVGDVVYVTVRMVKGPGGYPNRTSAIRLRRLGNWTSEEVGAQQETAATMARALEGLID